MVVVAVVVVSGGQWAWPVWTRPRIERSWERQWGRRQTKNARRQQIGGHDKSHESHMSVLSHVTGDPPPPPPTTHQSTPPFLAWHPLPRANQHP